ncbi:MAG: tetratricopeptide repeat-containing sensor histidine kinase [Cyclobacteriaceae bacterium]
MRLYLDIINTYNEFLQDKALQYEQPALELAKRLNSKSGEGDIINSIGRVYWRKGHFETALKYHNQAIRIFESLGDVNKVALSTRYLGQDYADGGNYPEALKTLSTALEMYSKKNDRKKMAYIHSLIQWVHGKRGDYPSATQSGYTALKLLEEIGDKSNMAIVLSDIAENYIYTGNYDAALKYILQGSQVYRAQGDSTNVAYNYNLIGLAYRHLGDLSKSLQNHSAALHIGQEINDFNIIANAYDGIAEVHLVRHDYQKALTNYKFSAEGFKAWRNRRDLSRVYCKIGESYLILKQYDLAKKYFSDALDIAKELEIKTLIADYYHGIAQLDSATGNWPGAYINYKKYIATKDSIFNQENIRKIVQMDMMHEFDIKEAAAKADQEKKDFEQRIESISLGIISLLIMILALVLYLNQKRIAKVNNELKLKSEKLEDENREKNSILNIVSHDLKAPFNKIKGLTDLIAMTPNMTEEQKQEYLMHVRNSVEQGAHLIQNLLDAQNVESATNKPQAEEIDLSSFIHNFQVDISGQLLKKRQQLQIDIETKSKTLATDKQMLTRILDNLLSNASKFSETGESIYLRIWSDKKCVYFSIRDQGPGISFEDQKKMFKKFQLLGARPTAGESSTGLGLSITKVLVDKLIGTIEVNSRLGAGTEFIVTLPL